MKKSKIYIALTFFLGVIALISCKEDKDYPELVLGNSAAPVATLSHVADSLHEQYTYIEVSSDMDGSIYFVALAQGSEAPSATAIMLGQTDPASTGMEVEAGVSYPVKLKNLSSGGSYDVYAVAANAEEGKPGAVVGPVSITCPDNTAPSIVEMNPANGDEWVDPAIPSITLTLSEAATLTSADMITLVDAFDESDLGVKGDVTIAGDVVTIELTDALPYYIEVAVIVEAGAFVDASDNASAEYYVDGGSYALLFTTADIMNIENFLGAYQCHEYDYAYGAEYIYDVLLVQSDVYSVDIINVFNYGVVATLVFDPVGDSCYIPDQPSGLSAGGDPLNFTSEVLIPDIMTFVPGSYTDDGITIRVSCWLYSPALGDLYFASDMEFTKYLTPGVKAVPSGDPARIAKGLKSYRKM